MGTKMTVETLKEVKLVAIHKGTSEANILVRLCLAHPSDTSQCLEWNEGRDVKRLCASGSEELLLDLLECITGHKFTRVTDEDDGEGEVTFYARSDCDFRAEEVRIR